MGWNKANVEIGFECCGHQADLFMPLSDLYFTKIFPPKNRIPKVLGI